MEELVARLERVNLAIASCDESEDVEAVRAQLVVLRAEREALLIELGSVRQRLNALTSVAAAYLRERKRAREVEEEQQTAAAEAEKRWAGEEEEKEKDP